MTASRLWAGAALVALCSTVAASKLPSPAWLLPVAIASAAVALEIVVHLVPAARRTARFVNLYHRLSSFAIVAVCVMAIGGVMAQARGWQVDGALTVAVGIVAMVLGNYMPKMTPNPIVGIRTPWTLADDDVWFRTHRAGGVVFLLLGGFIVGAGCAGWPPAWALLILSPGALALVFYSYALSRRLRER